MFEIGKKFKPRRRLSTPSAGAVTTNFTECRNGLPQIAQIYTDDFCIYSLVLVFWNFPFWGCGLKCLWQLVFRPLQAPLRYGTSLRFALAPSSPPYGHGSR